MDTHGHISFVDNPIFGSLAVALPARPGICFGGDILSLIIPDILALRYKVLFSLLIVWEKLSNASEVARFIIACGRGVKKTLPRCH